MADILKVALVYLRVSLFSSLCSSQHKSWTPVSPSPLI